MKMYHIKYLIREFEKFHTIYKQFTKESLATFRYDDENNRLLLTFDSDYPMVTIDYTDETIRHFNRMVNMVIKELKHYYHIENVKNFDDGKVCIVKILLGQ